MLTIDQAKPPVALIAKSLLAVEARANDVSDEQLIRLLGVLHAALASGLTTLAVSMGRAPGDIHPLGGTDKPPR
jgi:hypothetical protein